MQTPRVLICEESLFQRRLMSDLVECNDMQAVPVEGSDWIERLRAGADRASVVVVDLDQSKRTGLEVVKKLKALPGERRPRIVGLVDTKKLAQKARTFVRDCEEVLELPLDTGSFARAVVRQVRESRRDGSV